MIEKIIKAPDGHEIQTYIWLNEKAKAWVHIFHGMAEHAKRYDPFAQHLVSQGYSVLAHNHRGHGTSNTTILGQFAHKDGWQKVLDDLETVRSAVCNDANATPLPYYIFGHSMGSFIAQSYLTKNAKKIDGVILSASNLQNVFMSQAGKKVANFEAFRLGAEKPSKLLQFLSFGSFNKQFKPNRTEFDWLSRDAIEVDKYVADTLCGFSCSISLWQDFLEALAALFKPGSLQKVQANLPMLIIGGDQDPVGLMGKGLPKLAKRYQANGQQGITLKLYSGARHELLNESNRTEVIMDILTWLKTQKQ
jgi:alpha-beta hydrolase superfamily lysophospholipase